MEAIDPNSDESAIVRVRMLALAGPFSDSFESDLVRVCNLAEAHTRPAADPGEDGELMRPIIGIENRTAQEAFDIMVDRIRPALETQAATIARLREMLDEAFGNLDDCLSILQSGKWSNANDIANFIKVARAALSPNPMA